MIVFAGLCKSQESASTFPKIYSFPRKYHSFGVNLTSLIPKTKTFDHHFARQPVVPGLIYRVYSDVSVTQFFNLGLGLNYSFYRSIKRWETGACYFLVTCNLNEYGQKFTKIGEENFYELFFSSKINEKSTNIVLEPAFSISYQTLLSKNTVLNLEVGLGFNYHLFYYQQKESWNERNGSHLKVTQYYSPMQLFASMPLKAEFIYEFRKKRTMGFALTSQVNDSYSLLNKKLRSNNAENSIGWKHTIGLNSPAFIYEAFGTNNFPNRSFVLNFSISYKF